MGLVIMDSGDQMADGIYRTPQWRRVRLEILDRDGYQCRIRGPRCMRTADQVDHIVPVEDGGEPYDPDNLRAACGWCNRRRANLQKIKDGWRRSSARIVLVVGPTGAGKSTYVREHAGDRDVVVDYDVISGAFGPSQERGSQQRHEVTSVARNAVLTKIRRGEVEADSVWIVSANPSAESVYPHHEVVVVDPGRDEVLRRCGAERPASFARLVDEWYAARDGSSERPSREW